MPSDLDIYRTAHAMIKQFGGCAALEAGMRADKLLAAGNMDGKNAWVRVMRAIDELQRVKPKAGERVQ